jgi:DNA-binding MarR family transcriptional regulator
MEKYEELFISLRKIIRAIDLRSKKLNKESGVTLPQLLVMQEIERTKGITAREVSTNIHLSQATVTNILDRLEAKQFIKRVRSDSDRRRITLFLTNDGMTALFNTPKTIEDSFEKTFSALKEWEQYQLLSSVEHIAFLMGASSIDPSPVLNIGELTTFEETDK